MNMDQLLVCVFTDRFHKTRVVDCDDLWEMLTIEAPTGKTLYDEDDLCDLFGGGDWDRFNYRTINQLILQGDFMEWEELSRLFNHHWANRSEDNNYSDSKADNRGIFGFLNAGVLDHTMFSKWTFAPDPGDLCGAPTDFKLWMEARKGNYVKMDSMTESLLKLKAAATSEVGNQPIPVRTTLPRKAWLL